MVIGAKRSGSIEFLVRLASSSGYDNRPVGYSACEGMMAETINWARYERPLPEDTPVRHFQQSHTEWRVLKWMGCRLSTWSWSPSESVHVQNQQFTSRADLEAHLRALTSAGFMLCEEGDYPAGPTDYDGLRDDIKRYAIDAYSLLSSQLAAETLCGFALVSDSDAMSVDARATTLKAIEERYDALTSDEAFFIVAEWPHGDGHLPLPFMDAMKRKREWDVPFDPQVDHEVHRHQFYQACVSGLEAAQRAGVFPDQVQQDFVVLFQVMDDEEISGMFRRLNPLRLQDRYEMVI